MLDNLPEEIILHIISNFSKKNPIDFYKLRYINQRFKELILNYSYDFSINEYNNIVNDNITILCSKKTSVETFKWLFINQIPFTLNHVKNLIIYNRYDTINLGLHYSQFTDLLFNKFYLCEFNSLNDIFTYQDSDNPLIIAAKYNRIKIIKLLLELNKYGNPHLKGITSLLDISIKLRHRNLLLYLIHNYYDSIKDIFPSKICMIINSIPKCEDLLFYLVMSDKITITNSILSAIISKKYNDFFIYCYEKNNGKELRKQELLKITIQNSNTELFNYLINETSFDEYNISQLISNSIRKDKPFINNILKNHIKKLNHKSPIIRICLENDIDNHMIHNLVLAGYYYSYEELNIVLKNKDINLLKLLCDHYKQ